MQQWVAKLPKNGGGKTSKKYTMMNFVHDPPFLVTTSILLIISFRMIIILGGVKLHPPLPKFRKSLKHFFPNYC